MVKYNGDFFSGLGQELKKSLGGIFSYFGHTLQGPPKGDPTETKPPAPTSNYSRWLLPGIIVILIIILLFK